MEREASPEPRDQKQAGQGGVKAATLQGDQGGVEAASVPREEGEEGTAAGAGKPQRQVRGKEHAGGSSATLALTPPRRVYTLS